MRRRSTGAKQNDSRASKEEKLSALRTLLTSARREGETITHISVRHETLFRNFVLKSCNFVTCQITEKVIARELGHSTYCVTISIRLRLFAQRRSKCKCRY